MYIVYETDNNLELLRSKYLVLELDSLEINDKTTTAFAIIDSEHVQLHEIAKLDVITNLHCHLIKNYKLQNWDYCEQAIDHLIGSFKGELDSFYEELLQRVLVLKNTPIGKDWSGAIKQVDH
jgi:hypothetical protein